jgi:hypothetical protein
MVNRNRGQSLASKMDPPPCCHFAVITWATISARLSPGRGWTEDAACSHDRDIKGKVMPAELQHPRRRGAWLPENTDRVGVDAGSERSATLRQGLIGAHNIDDLSPAASGEPLLLPAGS